MTTKTTLSLILLLTVSAFFGGKYSSGTPLFSPVIADSQTDEQVTINYLKYVEPLNFATYRVSYDSPLPLPDRYVKFFAGYYYPKTGGYIYHIAYSTIGDLDNDGISEGVAMKMVNQGGTGSFPELVVLKKFDNEWKEVAGISEPIDFFYDRIITDSISIDKGIITVNILGFGPSDPACCPTTSKQMKFKFVDEKILTTS